MPRGISRAKHPELYAAQGAKATTAKKPVSSKLIKDMKTVAGAASKKVHWRTKAKQAQTNGLNDLQKLQALDQHLAILVNLKATDNVRDLLDEEIEDCAELSTELRVKIFGEPKSLIEERQQETLRAQTQPVTQGVSATAPMTPETSHVQQPVFTPPAQQMGTEQVPAQH